MTDMRLAWVGFHDEGRRTLEHLLRDGAPIRDVLTLRADLAAARTGGGDYAALCRRTGISLHEVTSLSAPAALERLARIDADIVFVIGWPQRVPREALRFARIGMIGAHASLLPRNRGSAPINWALIRGEQETGSSLYWFSEHAEPGDLIDQTRITITPYDSCATLYARVADANREMLSRLLPRLLAGERPGRAMPVDGPALARRRPADGAVDWAQSPRAVYDFVRAQTRPFTGAFSWMDGKRWKVWQMALPLAFGNPPLPGTVLGPVVSPIEDACGQLVSCADGAVVVLEVEDDRGEVLRGRALSEQPWTGRRWQGV
jgi:methionyl-tRNA formyltransferase